MIFNQSLVAFEISEFAEYSDETTHAFQSQEFNIKINGKINTEW